ncbi:Adenine permease AdeP [bioreactor metagenome]|uniref:Adenine permease AdeP n=2 Tax=root TaxID=1 RepID=A0A645JAF1_9ZZZZ
MASSVLEINFKDPTDAIPAFLTFVMMPLAYSIAEGIVFGIISYTILKFLCGQREKVNISLVVLSILFICKFIFL